MQRKNKSGFTLIELLVVVLIIGILAGVALPQYSTAVEKARSAEALSLMNAIAAAAERYCFQKDKWPYSLSQLDIEVPYSSSSYSSSYGGKNFAITLQGANTDCTTSSNIFTIKAERRDLTGNKGYTLKTTLQVDPDTETIVATRYCTFSSSGSQGETFCNAITNGHNSDGKF